MFSDLYFSFQFLVQPQILHIKRLIHYLNNLPGVYNIRLFPHTVWIWKNPQKMEYILRLPSSKWKGWLRIRKGKFGTRTYIHIVYMCIYISFSVHVLHEQVLLIKPTPFYGRFPNSSPLKLEISENCCKMDFFKKSLIGIRRLNFNKLIFLSI